MIDKSKPMHYRSSDGVLVVYNEKGPISINEDEYPDMWAEAQGYLAEHPEALVPEPVPEPPTEEELAARRRAEIMGEILDLEQKRQRPFFEGELERVEEITAQIKNLRAEMAELNLF